ncbi:uncharacterized protein isoform X5 [Rhodnius prolixus]|uniref:uncharacterized protein isoform X5 n=1 Tax=Rhodnius prolixus TaxID=13249 RepID=UPI003D18CD52
MVYIFRGKFGYRKTSQMKMDQPKYREKVLIGLEAAPPSFDVRGKVLGPGGANLLYITKETGAVVTLRGKDSGYIEANGHESIEPLHICVEHSRYEVLQAGRQLAFNLIETVQQEWAFQKEQLLQQPPPVTQQGPPPAPPPQLQQPPPAPLPTQSVQLHPPQIVLSGQTVNTSTTLPDQQHQLQVNKNLLQVASNAQNGNSSATSVQVSTVGGSGAVLIGSSGTSATPLPQGSASGEHAAGGMLPAGDAGRPSPPHAQHTLQVQQPRQVFVSQQGSLLPQPAALIPQQQQVIPPGSLLAQQPHIIQASYPVQYMQTSNGQMVLAYPNIVRPVLSGAAAAAAAADPTAGHQVMLVQYGQAGAATGLRPTLHHQAAATAAALRASQPMLAAAASPVSTGGGLAPPQLTQPQQTATAAIPQIVQIVNPQTGQIQHVIQHIQPQLHMQQDPVQVQLGGSVAGAAGALLGHQQVLMPVQQQLLTQLPGAAAAALQFGTAAAATNSPHHLHHAAAAAAQQQQLIIAQQVAQQQLQSVGLTQQQQQLLAAQTQVTSSSAAAAGLLSSHQALSQAQTTQQASTNQHQPTVSVQSTVQPAPQQGQKRRYEGEQNQFQSAPPPPHHANLSHTNSHSLRKGVGMEQRLQQQNQQQAQQQVTQQQQSQQQAQQQQQTQQQQQSQQQSQQGQEHSQVQASADGSKTVQQDEWRQQRESANDLQGMRDLVEKLQQDQVKRARSYHTNDYLWSVAGVTAGRLQRNQRADLLLTNRYLNLEAINNSVSSPGDQAQLRAVNKAADKPSTYLNYIQQQQQQQQSAKQQQQQQQQDGVWQQVYQPPPPPPHTPTPGTPTAVQYLHQQHQVYQPPPQHPQFPPPTHQYNPWIVPQ